MHSLRLNLNKRTKYSIKCFENGKEGKEIQNFIFNFDKEIIELKVWRIILPLLIPFVSLRTVHSSIVPNELNITRTSLSLYFLDTIPTNNFLSITGNKFMKNRT